MDALATSMSAAGQTGGAGQGNSNLQGMTPSRMPERPPQLSPLAASAAQRQNAMDQMATSGQMLRDQAGRRSAIFTSRQSQGGMAPATGTGNGMSEGYSAASMAGVSTGSGGSGVRRSPSGNGQSASTFEKTRFAQ